MALKEKENFADESRDRQAQLQHRIEGLVSENANLRSEMSETKQLLESEIRARENRDAKMVLDTQVRDITI